MNQYYPLIMDDIAETALTELDVKGEIPNWLNGELVRNGPGLFNFANVKLNHWFDGMAVIHKFSFKDGKVYYRSRFLQSTAYLSVKNEHKISYGEFATSPKQSFIGRIYYLLKGEPTDNNNVNIVKFGKYYLAMTETDHHVLLDLETLSIVKAQVYDDNIKFMLNLAHPIIGDGDKVFYNLGIKFGRISTYTLYKTDLHTGIRKIIAEIPTKKPAYIHSFAKTENYFILYENPLRLNPLNMFLSKKPFIENYTWDDVPVNFIILDKNGKIVRQIAFDKFFCFHVVNAFEDGDKIHLDLITYPNADIINAFYLEPKVNLDSKSIIPSLCRYVLDLETASCTSYKPDVPGIEFPGINSAYAEKQYNFIYAASSKNNNFKLDSLIKIDLAKNETKIWQQDQCLPGEPVFIADPTVQTEDTGVVISMVADLKNKLSFLLILDAKSFSEIARILLPHLLPMGLHGTFHKA
ncbi:MAG TPA: carotenoid oxygenase family protein [Aquella sp.]|nr:carotenoid oxygenase family protein [Aquella sp.]